MRWAVGFASITDLSSKRFEKAKRIAKEADKDGSEEQLTTVLGLAVGMSPIVEMTGGGVLERHPQSQDGSDRIRVRMAGLVVASDGPDS